MKFVAIFVVGLFSLTSPVQAQQLALRSGDHPTFSRITLQVPETQPWEAHQTTDGVLLSLPGFSGGFDTTDVFTRMRRNRIISLDAQSNTLFMKVECACISAAFRSGSLLVIDVADRGTILAGPALDGPVLAKTTPMPTIIKPRIISGTTLPWIGATSPLNAPSTSLNATIKNPSQTLNQHVHDRAVLLQEIQKTLVQEVANAASIGLLEHTYEAPSTKTVPTKTHSEPSPIALPEQVERDSLNLRITSSMDRSKGMAKAGSDATVSGISCPNDDYLPVETWGDETAFSAQLGQARNELMDARDRLDKNAAKKLAQTYIYFGFGAEALSVLRMDPNLEAESPELIAVAQILEHGVLARPNLLSHFTDCESSVALWASVSFDELPPDVLIDTDATLRALNKLPTHLRQVLTPYLSSKLLQYGDPQASAAALRSVERLPEPLTPNSLMAQANLALHSGKPAEAYLEDVIKSNTVQSPSALVKLVEGRLARGEGLSTKTATLVEAYAQELRGTHLGNQLRQTQIVALGQSGRFEEAFETLISIQPSLSPEATNQMRQTVLTQLGENADDLTFLENVFAQKAATIEALQPHVKILLAARLMDLGFAAQVQQMISDMSEKPRNSERQVLAARAALALRQPFQAQAELFGIDGAEAALVLAQAKELSGAFREASEIFTKMDAGAHATRTAWLSDEWRDLIPDGTSGFGAVANLAKASDNLANLGPLGRANLALEESGAARGVLEQLLNDPIIQLFPDS